MEPLQDSCRNKNVTEHNAPIYCRTADTDYANEGSSQPHYEPWRELVFLGRFPDEVLLEVGKWVEVCGVWIVKEQKKNGVNEERAIISSCDLYIY